MFALNRYGVEQPGVQDEGEALARLRARAAERQRKRPGADTPEKPQSAAPSPPNRQPGKVTKAGGDRQRKRKAASRAGPDEQAAASHHDDVGAAAKPESAKQPRTPSRASPGHVAKLSDFSDGEASDIEPARETAREEADEGAVGPAEISPPADDGTPHPATDETSPVGAAPMLKPLYAPRMAPPSGAQATAVAHVPQWIAKPTRVQVGVGSSHHFPLDQSGLCPAILSSLAKAGITGLFPIQGAAIPAIIRGYSQAYHPGDICVSAATGSGKTLTYVLPVVHCLRSRRVRRLRALVVLPTRELVTQVGIAFPSPPGGVPLCVCSAPAMNFTKKQLSLSETQC